MKILLVADYTELIQPLLNHFEKAWQKISFSEYKKGKLTVFPLTAGRTQVFMTYAICRFNRIKEIDRAINIGLASSPTRILDIGQTVNVGRDIFGDVGIEESNGEFKDLFDLKYLDSARFPFFRREIFNEDIINPLKHRVVKSLTVNKLPGTFEGIEAINKKYHVDSVSMNGAAFAYSCSMLKVKYLQYRTIYRYLEPSNYPDREKDLAIEKLNIEIIKILEDLEYQNDDLLRLID